MRLLSVQNPFGAPVYFEETVSSTMETARILAAGGEVHGTVITADFQESGRGRRNRPWKMEKGHNLSFTILLRYQDFSAIPKALTLRTGLAVSLAVEDFVPALSGSVLVKWPNDIMICNRTTQTAQAAKKAAGILTEAEGEIVYIGIGVNLAQRDFPEEIRNKAGSILLALEEFSHGEAAVKALLSPEAPFCFLEKILFRLYEELENDNNGSWKKRLEERLYKRGEQISFAEGAADSGKIVRGRLEGIGEGGELLIMGEGETKARPFITGELMVYG